MRILARSLLIVLISLRLGATALAGSDGRIDGVITASDGTPLQGVTVVLQRDGQTTDAAITARDGSYGFDALAAGDYQIDYFLGGRHAEAAATVAASTIATVESSLDWDVGYAEMITVESASRHRERIVDAPGAVTTVREESIADFAPAGQLPKLLEFTPGAQVTQSGVFDFNFNTRGFNNALTRRVQVLVDGRDASMAILSSNEWSLQNSLADDIASMEFLRGPSAALHGPNAFNGVINITTLAPRDSLGGMVRLTAGELDTTKADFRWAGKLSEGWYLKLTGGYVQNDSFARSRNQEVEYEGLGMEAVPLPKEKGEVMSGTLRLDRYFSDDSLLTLEGSLADGGGVTFVTPGGRTLIDDVNRQWARANYSNAHWNLLAYYDRRNAPGALSLSTGGGVDAYSQSYAFEVQGRAETHGVRLVGGAAYGHDEVDSADENGVQNTFSMPASARRGGVFGQADFDVVPDLKLTLAARVDDSTLHDTQFSPKAALVYALSPDHSLRATYNRAFQRANFGELDLRFAAGAIDLSGFEAGFGEALGGVPLHLEAVPILILGNRDLDVEKIQSYELGYSGIVARRALVSFNYYRNLMTDFITDVLPGINPTYGPYRAPAGIDPGVAAALEDAINQAVPGMSNDSDGSAIFVLSLGNSGEVRSQGMEAAVSASLAGGFQFDASYAWFDFNVKSVVPGFIISANAPRHSFTLGTEWHEAKVTGGLHYRWVQGFEWRSGIHIGEVKDYGVVDFNSSVALSPELVAGVQVSNLFDHEHYEVFGGDLLGRRALGYMTYKW